MERARAEIEGAAAVVVDAIVRVRREPGPGLLESACQASLAHELRMRKVVVQRQIVLPMRYAGIEVEDGYRIDMLIEDCIVLENKSVQALAPVHEAQLLTWLKLSGHRFGSLVNGNVPLVQDGLKRMVNEF